MLVLSRKKGETIVVTVGDRTITVVVVAVNGNKVRLGVEADKDIPVFRGELVHDGT